MKRYIGTKIIQAFPESKGPLPGGEEGYAVIYEDGYRSWSPKAVFEAAYKERPLVEGLQPHQQRVVDEKADLDEKSHALAQFIVCSPIFEKLDPSEQACMRQQYDAMRLYSVILGERIAAFQSPESAESIHKQCFASVTHCLRKMLEHVLGVASDVSTRTPGKCQGDRCMSVNGEGHSRECIQEAAGVQGWTPTEDDFSGCGPSAPTETKTYHDGTTATDVEPLPEASPTYQSGWILWGGGERPIDPSLCIDVRYRDGGVESGKKAATYRWDHRGWSGDIIAYRVIKETVRPDDFIEKEIQAKGLTAPRVTPADVEANIASEHYFTGTDGVSGAAIDAAGDVGIETLHVMMPIVLTGVQFCVLVLKNGHMVTGEALLQDLSKPDPVRARASARRRAFDKACDMVVYAERERLAQSPVEA